MDDIKAKIRKLLALGQSPNEHEAAIAMQKAAELMMKYNLDQADLGEQPAMIEGDLIDSDEARGHGMVANAVAHLCGCAAIYASREMLKVRFVGRSMNVETASAMFKFIVDQLDGIYKSHLPRGMSKAERAQFRREFRRGLAIAVCYRIVELDDSQRAETGKNALVVRRDDDRDEAEAFLKAQSGVTEGSRNVTIRETANTMLGMMAADQVRLRNEIK